MIDIKELIKSGIHFGHRTSRWSPKMKPFIWGAKNKIHLIDISKTAFLLERAVEYLKAVTAEGGSIMWIGTKKAARDIVKKNAELLGMPFVINRWVGGTLSNYSQIKKAITRLLHLRDVAVKSGSYYTKKELSTMNKEIARLEKNIGGIINLRYPPQAIFVIDAKKEHAAVREALSLGIPVIGIVDTNTDPTGINFVIPANDDSPRAIECIMNYIIPHVQEAQDAHAQAAQTEGKTAESAEAAPKNIKQTTTVKGKRVTKAIVIEEEPSLLDSMKIQMAEDE